MKPQSFEYVPTRTLDAALEQLARGGEDAKVLAGGQSLVPVMNLRLAQPGILVDINPVDELAHVETGDETIRVGALVRHRSLESAALGDASLDALAGRVSAQIGHLPIRVRGTIGGSLAHADPGAEWCLVAVALGAEVEIARLAGRRTIPIDDFLQGPFTTALEADELLVALRLPRQPGWRYGFAEHARTHGAFALAGACVALHSDGGTLRAARIAVMGMGGRAQRVGAAEEAVVGLRVKAAPAAAASATAAAVEPVGYDEVSPAYLRALAGALVRRAMDDALVGSGEERP